MSDLPEGWTTVALRKCVDVLDNVRVPVNSDERSKRQGAVPYYGATGQVGWIDDYLFDEELLLIGEDGAPFLDKSKPIAYIINGRSWVNNHAHVLRAKGAITTNTYLKHLLDHFDFHEYVNGTTRLKLTQGALSTIPVSLAPLNEQKRIVAKLEELFAKVEACQKRLAKIPVILKRFRQSVLSAACSGRLTADLREPEKDKDEWKEARLDALLSEPLANGRSVLTADRGFPVLRLTCLKKGRVDLTERKVGAWTLKDAENFLIRERDFLVARGNGSLSLVGRGGLVDGIRDDVAYPDTLIRVRVNGEEISPEFLAVLWESKYIRQQVESVAHTTAGIFKISQKSIEKFLLPVPPLSEQHEIVRRVDALFKFADQIEARYKKAQAQVDKLTQSILAKAFRGELAPTEAELARREGRDYEPASALLERIQHKRDESAIKSSASKATTFTGRKTGSKIR